MLSPERRDVGRGDTRRRGRGTGAPGVPAEAGPVLCGGGAVDRAGSRQAGQRERSPFGFTNPGHLHLPCVRWRTHFHAFLDKRHRMTATHARQITAVLVVGLALAACGSASRQVASMSLSPVARARADSARHPYTAADVSFMYHMIGHHAQAIVIAGWADSHGASPSVRTLAARIINAQRDEIAFMRQWLRNRLQPVPGAGAGANGMDMAMPMSGTHGDTLMPGMLTEAEMHQLDQARSAEFDRLFLTFMIQHHHGAVVMVQNLFATYAAAQDEIVFKLASDINVDQTTEIARMEREEHALHAGDLGCLIHIDV